MAMARLKCNLSIRVWKSLRTGRRRWRGWRQAWSCTWASFTRALLTVLTISRFALWDCEYFAPLSRWKCFCGATFLLYIDCCGEFGSRASYELPTFWFTGLLKRTEDLKEARQLAVDVDISLWWLHFMRNFRSAVNSVLTLATRKPSVGDAQFL